MVERKILLGSASPRRAYLLSQADIEFRILTSKLPETIDPEWPIEEIPGFLAEQKAEAFIMERKNDEVLLTADTIVVVDGQILGKPNGRKEARRFLEKLSGKSHHVITGVFMKDDNHEVMFNCSTEVTFTELKEREIDYYIKHYKPVDKAGAYGIQEWIGWCKITEIKGSYSNIVGLPIEQVYEQLRTTFK